MNHDFSPDEIRETYEQMMNVARFAALIDLAAARAVVHSMAMVDSLMPITDPTAWIKLRATAPAHNRLAQAFVNLRTVLEEFKPDEQ